MFPAYILAHIVIWLLHLFVIWLLHLFTNFVPRQESLTAELAAHLTVEWQLFRLEYQMQISWMRYQAKSVIWKATTRVQPVFMFLEQNMMDRFRRFYSWWNAACTNPAVVQYYQACPAPSNANVLKTNAPCIANISNIFTKSIPLYWPLSLPTSEPYFIFLVLLLLELAY